MPKWKSMCHEGSRCRERVVVIRPRARIAEDGPRIWIAKNAPSRAMRTQATSSIGYSHVGGVVPGDGPGERTGNTARWSTGAASQRGRAMTPRDNGKSAVERSQHKPKMEGYLSRLWKRGPSGWSAWRGWHRPWSSRPSRRPVEVYLHCSPTGGEGLCDTSQFVCAAFNTFFAFHPDPANAYADNAGRHGGFVIHAHLLSVVPYRDKEFPS